MGTVLWGDIDFPTGNNRLTISMVFSFGCEVVVPVEASMSGQSNM